MRARKARRVTYDLAPALHLPSSQLVTLDLPSYLKEIQTGEVALGRD